MRQITPFKDLYYESTFKCTLGGEKMGCSDLDSIAKDNMQRLKA